MPSKVKPIKPTERIVNKVPAYLKNVTEWLAQQDNRWVQRCSCLVLLMLLVLCYRFAVHSLGAFVVVVDGVVHFVHAILVVVEKYFISVDIHGLYLH